MCGFLAQHYRLYLLDYPTRTCAGLQRRSWSRIFAISQALKWHEYVQYDESALANPNRCKVKIGLMHEGSARAGIIVIGGIFR